MNAFDFAAPTSVEDAIRLLDGQNTSALSGGTDLLSRIKDQVTAPQRVVYIKDIKANSGISGDAGSGLTIGSGTLLAAMVDHKAIREAYSALWQSTIEVGTPQIRNMATLGGNLLQRPRCWYFRAGNGLLAMKDGKSLIRGGDNRYHAIFMTDGDALYVNPSSLAVPLIALGATATIKGPKGERTVPVEDLYLVPKTDKESELSVAPGELLTKVMIPPARGKNASYEVRQKQAHDWPIVLASVNLTFDGNNVSASRIVIYGVAPIPWRSAAAEKSITGKLVTLETAAVAGEDATEGAMPLSMNAYKVSLTKTAVKRALLAAVGKRYWEY
jgi:xanthine dehydrogenase YagS FAD-binding subunit